jgi:hypothetical protein
MSFLRGLVQTPQLGDKGVGNVSVNRTHAVEIPTFAGGLWDTASGSSILSTVLTKCETGSHLVERLVIHKLDLAITTNIYN